MFLIWAYSEINDVRESNGLGSSAEFLEVSHIRNML